LALHQPQVPSQKDIEDLIKVKIEKEVKHLQNENGELKKLVSGLQKQLDEQKERASNQASIPLEVIFSIDLFFFFSWN